MAIPHEQADFDARFAALTAGRFLRPASDTRLPRCEDLTEQDFRAGVLAVSGVDEAELRRFQDVQDRWYHGELSFEGLADELRRGEPGE